MVQTGGGSSREPAVRRVSVSFDAADYEELRKIAAEKRVSLAWVVRDAVAAYIFPPGSPLPAAAPLPARPEDFGVRSAAGPRSPGAEGVRFWRTRLGECSP